MNDSDFLRERDELIRELSDSRADAANHRLEIERLTAQVAELQAACAGLLPFILEEGVPEQYWTDELKAAVNAARAALGKEG